MSMEVQLISQQLQQACSNSLWCADESAYILNAASFKGTALTNRYDIYQQLKKLGINVLFNNFDFDSVDDNYNEIIFRIAKEKAINLHVISHACNKLNDQGMLTLFGAKTEGIKRYSKLIKEDLHANISVQKFKNQFQQLSITQPKHKGLSWLDQPYHANHNLTINGLSFTSKYGVFGWDKIDKGSDMLMQAFTQHCQENTETDKNASILDLGCGYGYLSMIAKELGFIHIDATDNNAAAIEAAKENFKQHVIKGEVIEDNCGQSIAKQYDIILCNPPFHKGFSHHKNISLQFIENMYRLLKPKGQAFIVSNQFIGIETLCQGLFSGFTLLKQENGFKVIVIKR